MRRRRVTVLLAALLAATAIVGAHGERLQDAGAGCAKFYKRPARRVRSSGRPAHPQLLKAPQASTKSTPPAPRSADLPPPPNRCRPPPLPPAGSPASDAEAQDLVRLLACSSAHCLPQPKLSLVPAGAPAAPQIASAISEPALGRRTFARSLFSESGPVDSPAPGTYGDDGGYGTYGSYGSYGSYGAYGGRLPTSPAGWWVHCPALLTRAPPCLPSCRQRAQPQPQPQPVPQRLPLAIPFPFTRRAAVPGRGIRWCVDAGQG